MSDECAAMPLYYLHIQDGANFMRDQEGYKLPTLAAARLEAIEGARQLMSEAVLTGRPLGMHRLFQIDDAGGNTLMTVPFSDAINEKL
jgi:hypothetical protein